MNQGSLYLYGTSEEVAVLAAVVSGLAGLQVAALGRDVDVGGSHTGMSAAVTFSCSEFQASLRLMS